jgi:hypothetical protein
MAQTPVKTLSVEEKMAAIMAGMATIPAVKADAAQTMAKLIAAKQGIQWDSLSTGGKAVRTRRVKEQAKTLGITL